MNRPTIRQNPAGSTKTPPGEQCPLHGYYVVPWAAVGLRRQATSQGVPAAKARRLLADAERMRRTCPGCGGLRPADRDWAVAVRLRVAP